MFQIFQNCFYVLILFTDCPQLCTSDYTPVCGTDSKTYSNECAMEVAACKDGKTDLTVAYVGECSGISQRFPTNEIAQNLLTQNLF